MPTIVAANKLTNTYTSFTVAAPSAANASASAASVAVVAGVLGVAVIATSTTSAYVVLNICICGNVKIATEAHTADLANNNASNSNIEIYMHHSRKKTLITN